jgi:hypothetical protein
MHLALVVGLAGCHGWALSCSAAHAGACVRAWGLLPGHCGDCGRALAVAVLWLWLQVQHARDVPRMTGTWSCQRRWRASLWGMPAPLALQLQQQAAVCSGMHGPGCTWPRVRQLDERRDGLHGSALGPGLVNRLCLLWLLLGRSERRGGGDEVSGRLDGAPKGLALALERVHGALKRRRPMLCLRLYCQVCALRGGSTAVFRVQPPGSWCDICDRPGARGACCCAHRPPCCMLVRTGRGAPSGRSRR